jgi:EF-P beta-lysylation protein EpmB
LGPTPDARSTPAVCSWQLELQQAIRDPGQLVRELGLPTSLLEGSDEAAGSFGVLVPASYLSRIRYGDPHDPLLAQVLAVGTETRQVAGFAADPVADGAAQESPGLLHKYAGRVLLVVSGTCAIHCRYCFRRNFPYDNAPRSMEAWEPAVAQIESDASLSEVIFSGGDPLTWSDARLAELAGRLQQIPHLKRLRVHTRLPVVIPSRVTGSLIAWLTRGPLTPIVVLHVNHAREIDTAVAGAIARLREAGVMLLNQAVLLAGVNDSVESQEDLAQRLIEVGVVPYYLHQLDRVTGAAHFEVPVERGRALVAALRERLPGYAVPRYVREQAGHSSKSPL